MFSRSLLSPFATALLLVALACGGGGPDPEPDGGDSTDGGATPDAGDLPADAGLCTEGATRACYTGAEGTAGVGTCTGGTQTCETGAWTTACAGEVTPIEETSCNGADEDCDGASDEGLTSDFYLDSDGDTYGDQGVSVAACSAPPGYVASGLADCDDQASSVSPGAAEQCNGVDDNCDTSPDNATTASMCPATRNVQYTQCTGPSGCAVGVCNSGSYDVDGDYATGCECDDDLAGSTCQNSTNLGTINSGVVVQRTGRLPLPNQLDWYVVGFPAGPGNPTVRLISNPLEYRFNLLFGSCGGSGGGCTAGGNTTALYTWVHNQSACTEIDYCTTCGTMPSVVYIRVERTSTGSTCASYTLQVTR